MKEFGSQVDIIPTIVDVLDLPVPEGLQGKSLLPAISGRGLERVVYGENLRGSQDLSSGDMLRFLIHGRYKLITMGTPKTVREKLLFDLQSDPHEKNNICGSEKKIAEEMESLLEDFIALVKKDPRYSEDLEAVEVDPELQKRLKALGYIE